MSESIRYNRTSLPNGNTPYGKREDSTEYGILLNGEVVTVNGLADGPSVTFTSKRDAVAFLTDVDNGTGHILHRRVVRETFAITTPTAY